MAKESYRGPLEQVEPFCWRIPKEYRPGMRVDGLIFTSEALLPQVLKDQARHALAHEVKAITYHRLKVERTADGWLAEVIVDI